MNWVWRKKTWEREYGYPGGHINAKFQSDVMLEGKAFGDLRAYSDTRKRGDMAEEDVEGIGMEVAEQNGGSEST